jgi:ABC-type transport system involved in cytochrome c biogenesis permease subunit
MDLSLLPPEMSNAALFAIIVGFIQPLVLQFILNSKWSASTQALAAFVFSILTGSATAYFAGAFTGLGIVTTILLVAVVSIAFYRGFWKQVTPNLKAATTPNSEGVYKTTTMNDPGEYQGKHEAR